MSFHMFLYIQSSIALSMAHMGKLNVFMGAHSRALVGQQ